MHVLTGHSAHSGRYGHKNETLILQTFAFIMQFDTYFNGNAANCPGSQLVVIFQLPLNVVFQLAYDFKILKL